MRPRELRIRRVLRRRGHFCLRMRQATGRRRVTLRCGQRGACAWEEVPSEDVARCESVWVVRVRRCRCFGGCWVDRGGAAGGPDPGAGGTPLPAASPRPLSSERSVGSGLPWGGQTGGAGPFPGATCRHLHPLLPLSLRPPYRRCARRSLSEPGRELLSSGRAPVAVRHLSFGPSGGGAWLYLAFTKPRELALGRFLLFTESLPGLLCCQNSVTKLVICYTKIKLFL